MATTMSSVPARAAACSSAVPKNTTGAARASPRPVATTPAAVRSSAATPRGWGRARSTAIYYLLVAGEVSAWHRVDATEVWHFYAGAALALTISEDGETWFAITTGLGVAELLGERAQVVGVYQRREDGWVEVTRRRLESTPNHTNASLVPGVGQPVHAWIAVYGRIKGAGATFELLRFDGSELSSQLWWYSPTGEAAQLVDAATTANPANARTSFMAPPT